ncbi:MAG TPA: SpoIIE family protein phosphatase [Acidobacteriaceae bacterium]|jgi:serine phosphatase RsbU (regulator of sigma subunit)|nr:SpoIIE family protein phosphatase [Acidobacteriaceae bacterium]
MSTNPIPLSFVLVDGPTRRTGNITHSPFTVGRLPDNDLVLAHPYVSRRHAEIIVGEDGCYVVDQRSTHGTFVNGKPATSRHLIGEDDAVQFGALDGPSLRIGALESNSGSTIRDIISQIPDIGSTGTALERLRWFFESARKLKSFGAVDQILGALLDTTLQLTQVERGYVFLTNDAGQLELALGRDDHGEALTDEATLSHGAIRQAVSNASEYILTDTLSADPEARSASIVAHSIRSVICIPLRKRRPGAERVADLLGLLYLDSRLKPGSLTQIDNDLLRTIATDAAALIDNARLAMSEERERRYREELNIAAEIQRNLMTTRMPDLPWASVSARSVACREVGGDFYDVVEDGQTLSVVVADISGKGISAAILASTLQGLIWSLLFARQPLGTIAEVVNRYICGKDIEKYATMAILRMTPDGQTEYITCGHVPPFLYAEGCVRLPESNLPVGLIEGAPFQSGSLLLQPGSRVLIVTDGVTESQMPDGEFYGEEPLTAPEMANASLDDICNVLMAKCGSLAADDDCTLLDVRYLGRPAE